MIKHRKWNYDLSGAMENGVKVFNPLQKENELTPLFNNGKLSLSTRIAFSVGHVFNDICAAIWFTYSLIFLQLVVEISPTQAGALLFLGQTVDAVSTPISGYILDRCGERKRWHLFGSILVTISFPLIFTACASLAYTPWMQAIYYITSITVFQIGWALVQISHLSLLTELTPSAEERAELTAHRYTASMSSHIIVYLIAWMFLNSSHAMDAKLIGPSDAWRFRDIVLVTCGIGIICSAVFHQVLDHNQSVSHSKVEIYGACLQDKVSRLYKSLQLYKIAILYTTSRLFMTISLEYIPLYINETVLSGAGTLATVPLVSFIVSAITSLLVRQTRVKWGNKTTYTLGCALCVIGCIIVKLNSEKTDDTAKIFCIAILFGAGSAINTVISLCLTANLIGGNIECGAFVYSTVTFADKLLNGLAVVIIEYMKCNNAELCPYYYGNVLSNVNGIISLIGLVALLSLPSELFTGAEPNLPT